MRERYFRSKYITRLQQIAWYLFVICFAVTTTFYFLGYPLAEDICYWGIILILLITSLVIVTIGEQFRKTKLFRFWLLCYMLIVILLSVILTKVYFHNG